jgi:pimeloyl-ACP methyl ester carboxylesterase
MVLAPYTEHDVAARGLNFHYQEWGDPLATPVFMLHGFGVSGHMFDEFAQRMEKDYHLIALDQRGHGDSQWAEDGDYSREAFVADAEAVREALGLERFILVGHSMGGLNAVSYAVEHPQRVRALILVDVGPESAKEGVDNIVRFTRGPDDLEFDQFVEMAHQFNKRRSIDNIRERMRHRLKPTENGKFTWKFDARFRKQDNGLKIGNDLTNDETWQLFRRVEVPTLLVRGAESDVLSMDVAARAEREMKYARLAVIPGAGHSVPGDNPDDFTTAVRAFLADINNGAFEPAAATEPPPLHELVQEQEAARRRGIGLGGLILAGVGAALAIAGVSFALKRRANSNKRKRDQLAARAASVRGNLPQVPRSAAELDAARQRAAEVVAELSTVGRSGLAHARQIVGEADLSRARSAAGDVVHLLGESGRQAPAAAKSAAARVDRTKLRRRGNRAVTLGKKAGIAAARAALKTGRKPVRRRGFPWR